MTQRVKNPPDSAGASEDPGSIPGWGRSPGGGNGNSLQYYYLENSMDRGTGSTTVHGVAKNWTQLSKHTIQRSHKITEYKRKLINVGKNYNYT